MPQFIQKVLIKWSAIALLGVSAYFVGYFWGYRKLESNEARQMASQKQAVEVNAGVLNQPAHLGELKQRVH